MRVLMATPGFYPIIGGTESVVRGLTINLNEKKIHTDVLTYNMEQKWNPKWQGKIETLDGYKVFKIPALNWFPLTHSKRITMGVNVIPGKFTHLFKDYDVLHFHEDLSFPLFSYFSAKPKIFHLHGLDINFYKRYFISRHILKSVADLYICLTKLMTNQLSELGIPKEKIRWLPNGIDVNTFHPSGKKKDNLILYVGRVCPQKGLHVLLKALANVEQPIHLVIIGPLDWGLRYYQSIMKLIENEKGRGKHKITYLGKVDRKELIRWYQKASLFVLPSVWQEPLGIVSLEAMSCETPVIATKVGGVPEVVYDGVNGILVPPNEFIELAQAIQYLLDNEDVSRRYGKEGKKLVMENFSNEIIVKKLCQIYKELV